MTLTTEKLNLGILADMSVYVRPVVILIPGCCKSLDYVCMCSVGVHKNKEFENWAISWSEGDTDLQLMLYKQNQTSILLRMFCKNIK